MEIEMKYKAGERLKAIRELMGITQQEFSENLDIDIVRLRNIEQKKCRMGEDEFAKIGQAFPEIMPWLTWEGDLVIHDLKESQNIMCRLIAAKIEAMQIPDGIDLKDKIK